MKMDVYTTLKNYLIEAKNYNTHLGQITILKKIFQYLKSYLDTHGLILFHNLMNDLFRNINTFNLLSNAEILEVYTKCKFNYIKEYKKILDEAKSTDEPNRQLRLLEDIINCFFPNDWVMGFEKVESRDKLRILLLKNLELFDKISKDEITATILKNERFLLNPFRSPGYFLDIELLHNVDKSFYPSLIKNIGKKRSLAIINNFNFLTKELKINPFDLARYTLEEGDQHLANFIAQNISLFDEKYHIDIADLLINSNNAEPLIKNVKLFKNLELNADLALKIIKNGQIYCVVDNIQNFRNLNAEVAQKLIDDHNEGLVISNIENFKGLNSKILAMIWNSWEKQIVSSIKSSPSSFDIDEILKTKDKTLVFKSYYVYEIVKHPSLIADFCS